MEAATNPVQPEDTQIDINDPVQVESLHGEYPRFSIEEIRAAIQSAGPAKGHIAAFLTRGNPSKGGELR